MTISTTPPNTLYYGDNLDILRLYIANESVDLIYLDPPFNSNRSHNVLFKDESGRDSDAQITAFEDCWHWGPSTESLYRELLQTAPELVASVLGSLIDSLGRTNQMCAYIVMMAARLIELRRVLKPTGSIYLHCDDSASHYLKLILDVIFGPENYRNEVIWKRTYAHNDPRRYGRITDTIFFYTKTNNFTWNTQYTPYSEDYIKEYFKKCDERGHYQPITLTGPGTSEGESGGRWRGYSPTDSGRTWSVTRRLIIKLAGEEGLRLPINTRLDLLDEHGYIYWPPKGRVPRLKQYLNEMPGAPAQNLWTDIKRLSSRDKERLGYPTQKPRALLERIISSSSNKGDLILDPFCGCGTAVDAAHHLGRRWVGIDTTHLAVSLMKYRLRDRYDIQPGCDYEVIGEPTTLQGAFQLASEDRYQFQWWALSLVGAKPLGAPAGTSRRQEAPTDSRRGKKGADRGIDGVINFIGDRGKSQRAIIQVKSGTVNSGDIRDLRGTLERENAALAAFITLESPSRPMQTEALAAGFYETESWGNFPRLQLLTVEALLSGEQQLEMPREYGTFRRATRAKAPAADQKKMRLE